MEEIFVVEDNRDGNIRIISSLSDLKKGKNDFYVVARITGSNLNVENWGTSANEDLFVALDNGGED